MFIRFTRYFFSIVWIVVADWLSQRFHVQCSGSGSGLMLGKCISIFDGAISRMSRVRIQMQSIRNYYTFFFEIHATNQYANTIFWILIETAINCGEFCNDTKPNSIELSLYSYTFKEVDDG